MWEIKNKVMCKKAVSKEWCKESNCLKNTHFNPYIKAPNSTIDNFANTVDPDETAHHEISHLDPQCLPFSL